MHNPPTITYFLSSPGLSVNMNLGKNSEDLIKALFTIRLLSIKSVKAVEAVSVEAIRLSTPIANIMRKKRMDHSGGTTRVVTA